MSDVPCLLITLGDVAGIGPEILVRAWADARLHRTALTVVGDVDTLQGQAQRWQPVLRIVPVDRPQQAISGPQVMPVLQATAADLRHVPPGCVSAAAGQAAYDFLCRAADLVLAGQAQGIVTLPLHKEGLKAAGVPFPGHTEILAHRTGTSRYAMMLWHEGLGVTHVTLHLALRDIFAQLTQEAILEKIELTARIVERLKARELTGRKPRIGVCALNPHAGEGGLFGREEEEILTPAIRLAQAQGYEVSGPWPSDTIFVVGRRGGLDGIIALYHDQGHIAMKLLAGFRAVNITLGLPVVRTSVAHGTAYDLVGRGVADCEGLVAAVRAAAQLCEGGP
jgi:4-hydroxythreonine-4-phosphate dehydrogenase